MTTAQLKSALKAVDWNSLVAEFESNESAVAIIDACCTRIAIWSKQFESADKGNPALSFIRASQTASQHVAATCALGLYKSAAASIRGILENGLYFTYFRIHRSELTTLARDPGYYVSRGELIAYHKIHTPDFKALQEKFGFIGNLDTWYSEVSRIVHGQIPGAWVEHTSLNGIKHNVDTLDDVVKRFKQGEELLHQLYLLTSGRELWDSFSLSAKRSLLAVLSSNIKAALGLHKA